MALDKNWRPENWDRIKENIVNECPVVFSPSVGYSKEQKMTLIEKTASVLMGALAEAILTDNKE